MKVLLDENLPKDFRRALSGHEVSTVQYLEWCGTRNGLLLAQAAGAGFDVLITMDSGFIHQQNTAKLPLAVIVLTAISNDIEDLRPLVPRLLAALNVLKPRTITLVS